MNVTTVIIIIISIISIIISFTSISIMIMIIISTSVCGATWHATACYTAMQHNIQSDVYARVLLYATL